LHLQTGDVKGIHHLLHAFHLWFQVFRHFGAGGLVGFVALMTEGLAGIKSNRQVIRVFLFQDA
jgi:hypothetical protein